MKVPVAMIAPFKTSRVATLMFIFISRLCLPVFDISQETRVQAAEPVRMVELSDLNTTYAGKLIAKTPSHVCIMDRFGMLTFLEISNLKSFKVVAGAYSPVSSIGLQQSLKKELPPGYEIAASAH